MTGSAKQSFAPQGGKSGLLPPSLSSYGGQVVAFAPRNDTKHAFAISRREAPELGKNVRPRIGADLSAVARRPKVEGRVSGARPSCANLERRFPINRDVNHSAGGTRNLQHRCNGGGARRKRRKPLANLKAREP
jgi:hypothetical protein